MIKTCYLEKAKKEIVTAIDQNDDGALDIKDVSALAQTVGILAKSAASVVKNSTAEKNREIERKALRPIFAEDLDKTDFLLSKLIRLTTIDKKRAESPVCVGSIGFISVHKDLSIVNIFKDKADYFKLTFFPNAESELYYVDPSDRDRYNALDSYFEYLKNVRIDELQKIAQDLGAKHFRVTYKEQQTSTSNKNTKLKGTGKTLNSSANINADIIHASTEKCTVEVAAEMTCPGHAPFEPKLCYLQQEHDIQTLISLRMDSTSPITHYKRTLQFSNSSGIKENDAIRIDAALKALKIVANTTIANEVRNEFKRFLEYELDF